MSFVNKNDLQAFYVSPDRPIFELHFLYEPCRRGEWINSGWSFSYIRCPKHEIDSNGVVSKHHCTSLIEIAEKIKEDFDKRYPERGEDGNSNQ